MALRSSRLEKERLEKALEELCDDKLDEVRVDDNMMIHGHEKTAGVDPNFAGLLHDKLSQKVDDPQPSGLRAPCVTGVLTAQELAALDDDEVDDGEKAAHANEKPSGGFSSDLSAALERKLGGQATDAANKGGFESSLTAALEKQFDTLGELVDSKSHGTIDAINHDLIAAVERKFGHQRTNGDLEQDDVTNVSGLRAPQCTVMLSAEALSSLNAEDDEEEDTTKPALATHGAIDNIDDKLVLELQRKLASAGEENEETCEAAEFAEPEPVGFRAPQNTMKLTSDMIDALDDEDEPHSHGAIDGIDSKLVAELQKRLEADSDDPAVDSTPVRGCRAPQPTMKLSKDMLLGMDLEDDIEEVTMAPPPTMTNALKEVSAKLAPSQETVGKKASGKFDPSFAAELHHQLQEKKEDRGGLRAPEPTQQISADLLADLDDEEETTGNMLNDAVAALQALPAREASESSILTQGQLGEDKSSKQVKKSISFRNSCGTDKGFAANLAQKLGQGMPEISGFEDGSLPVGTRAPPGTTTLTDSALEEVWNTRGNGDDVETDHKFEGGRIAPQSTQVLSAEMLAEVDECSDDDDDRNPVMESGMKAPQCTAVFSIEQLAELEEDDEKQADTLLNVAPCTAETEFAAKVMQNMRDLPEGNSKPLSSSCKLRLAWLSDDEVKKENDVLRREIVSLRAQIEMHRKEPCFARK